MRVLCDLVAHLSPLFFFSSRRRHTRSLRDWSSDVCSSDLSPRLSAARRARTSISPSCRATCPPCRRSRSPPTTRRAGPKSARRRWRRSRRSSRRRGERVFFNHPTRRLPPTPTLPRKGGGGSPFPSRCVPSPLAGEGRVGGCRHQPRSAPMTAIRIVGVGRNFAAVAAVDGVSLDVADGEFFTLLGPSG